MNVAQILHLSNSFCMEALVYELVSTWYRVHSMYFAHTSGADLGYLKGEVTEENFFRKVQQKNYSTHILSQLYMYLNIQGE